MARVWSGSSSVAIAGGAGVGPRLGRWPNGEEEEEEKGEKEKKKEKWVKEKKTKRKRESDEGM